MSEATTKAVRTPVKQVPNGTLYSDGTILLKNVRASFPHVLKPSSFEGSEPAFSIRALMPKGSHGKTAALVKAANDKLLADAKLTGKVAADKLCLRDGDLGGKDEEDGCWTVSARDKKRPRVLDANKDVLSEKDIDRIYGGCYVNVLVRPWLQNNAYGKRVNCNLVAVQFVRDGEAFGEGRISDDAIADTFDDESGDGSDDGGI
jgi:hypothetical protein